MPKPLVSVITPMYKAADVIHISLQSLLSQTYRPLELIFVDDCCPQGSANVVSRFVEKITDSDISIKIIQHTENQGVAVARNTGLDNATGKYIYYVDADDWIDNQAIEQMVGSAEQTDADIIGCNWYLTFSQNERLMRQPELTSPLDGIRKMMCGVMRWNLWMFLVKRSLYEENNIRFIPQMNMGEDLMATIKLFANARKVVHLDEAFYHYAQNEQSISRTFSEKIIREVTANVAEVERFLSTSPLAKETADLLPLLKLNIKLPLLISEDKQSYQQWKVWFPEANAYTLKNKMLPLRTKLLQWCAAHNFWMLVKLYNKLVFKLVYGIIYK